MTTSDKHVKWVCRDHYRVVCKEADTQKLRYVVKIAGGRFDEQLGKADISLKSSFAAEEFYDALCKANGVLELIVDLKWNCVQRDITNLGKAVQISSVSILYLDFRGLQPNFGDQRLHISLLSRLLEGSRQAFRFRSRTMASPSQVDLGNGRWNTSKDGY